MSTWGEYKKIVMGCIPDASPYFADLQHQRPSTNGWVTACCPFHDDKNPSFAYKAATGNWKCRAGCGHGSLPDYLAKERNLTFGEALLMLGDEFGVARPNGEAQQSTEYDYTDAGGQLLFQVVRKPGKKWSQRRPDGKGNWTWRLGDVERVLYRLPELLARAGETVFLVEGEKDVHRVAGLGLLATTNSGGAGKWRDEYSEVLRDRDVVILPDNDLAGLKHAATVGNALKDAAKSVRVVMLPGLGSKQDVSDWLDAGGDRRQLETLVDQAAEYEPGSLDTSIEPRTMPVIETSNRPLRDILDDAQTAVLAANTPPQVFVSAGRLVSLKDLGHGPQIELLEERAVINLLARAADWMRTGRGDPVHTKPPKEAAVDLVVNPHDDLPVLDAVITTPVFDHNWNLIKRPGYHPESKLWLHLPFGTAIPPVSPEPNDAEVAAAQALILDDLLIDFPFAADSDRAHAVAALILPFARRMFDGPTPIHLIEASTPGSGKSLLAELISIIALGHAPASTTLTANEEESRKKITAILAGGPAVISIDNLAGGLWSSQIASVITADFWEDRQLGVSKMVNYRNRSLWLASGNNPKLSMEIARRCVRIRIDPRQEQPWKRSGFKHDPIQEWVRQHRLQLVHAILTLIRHWIMSRGPRGTQPNGSFANWASVVGGMIQHFGLPGFLADSDEFYAAADSETGEWSALVTAWWEQLKGAPVGAGTLLGLAKDKELVAFAYVGQSDPSQRARFGKALNDLRGRKFDGLEVVITQDAHAKKRQYMLRPTTSQMLQAGDEVT